MLLKEICDQRFNFFWDINQTKYSYDALGRRSQKKVTESGSTQIRKYVYDGDEILAELDGNNSVLVRYTHSGLRTDDVLAMDVTSAGVGTGIAPSTGTYHFLKDGLGSVIDIADADGNVMQHYVYGSFGKILKVTNGGIDSTADPLIKNRYTFTGREYDEESGFYYYRARYYDAHSGRFLQEDPHPGKVSRPKLFNKYIYTFNNPTILVDPNGKLPFLVVAILIGSAMGGLDAASKNGNILDGMVIGAVSGLAIGSGIMAASALVGVGAGVTASFWAKVGAWITEAAVSGFLSGLFNASALSIVKQDGKDWAKDFKNGFIGGSLGTSFKGAGVAEGVETSINVDEIGVDDLGEQETMEALKKFRLKQKLLRGF